jgi:nucleoid DNA-binding protein
MVSSARAGKKVKSETTINIHIYPLFTFLFSNHMKTL